MDLNVTTEVFHQDDQSWLGSGFGTETARPVTLDVSAFTQATHYPNGYLPSGTALVETATPGLYGPSDGLANVIGFLLSPLKVHDSRTGRTSTRVAGALMDRGRIKRAQLPFQTGTGSVAATDSNPHFIWV